MVEHHNCFACLAFSILLCYEICKQKLKITALLSLRILTGKHLRRKFKYMNMNTEVFNVHVWKPVFLGGTNELTWFLRKVLGSSKRTLCLWYVYFVFIFSVTSFMTVQKQPPEVFYKKLFLKIYQNSQEKKPVPGSPFNKVAGRKCFPVNFAKFLITLFLKNTSGGCFCLF